MVDCEVIRDMDERDGIVGMVLQVDWFLVLK